VKEEGSKKARKLSVDYLRMELDSNKSLLYSLAWIRQLCDEYGTVNRLLIAWAALKETLDSI
jgi:hypothetical protein